MSRESAYVDTEKWSKRLNLPYYKQEWFNYRLGTGWKDKQGTNLKANSVKIGHVLNFEVRRSLNQKLNLILDNIINDEWESIACLYSGLIGFCLKYCAKDITYYEDNRRKNLISMSKCCEELKFPTWCRGRLEKIFKMTPSLEKFLHAFDNAPQVNFDTDAALMVYKMQGEKAIFSILMQLFFNYKYVDVNTVNLVPDLPIIWTPKVSNLVTGTNFPVVATKFSNKFRWERINESFFLFDEFNNVIDCASLGNFSVFKEFLGNRLNFLSHSGFLADYLICWSWGDLVNAVGHYNGDILVRNLSGKFEKWFKFGPNGTLAVWTNDGYVYSKKSNKKIPKMRIDSYPGEGKWVAMVNLSGKRVDDKLDEEVVWNWEEMCDWFELGQMCNDVLDN